MVKNLAGQKQQENTHLVFVLCFSAIYVEVDCVYLYAILYFFCWANIENFV